jgi:hypothetical protein
MVPNFFMLVLTLRLQRKIIMKNFKIIYIILLLNFNFSAVYGTTNLLIRAQDDETEGGVKILLSIPQKIYDGPKGDGIEILDKGNQKAVRDKQGNFLKYEDVDEVGNLAPHIFLTSLEIINRQRYARVSVGDKNYTLQVTAPNLSVPYVVCKIGDNTYTYDIPSNLPFNAQFYPPLDLRPLDATGERFAHKVSR